MTAANRDRSGFMNGTPASIDRGRRLVPIDLDHDPRRSDPHADPAWATAAVPVGRSIRLTPASAVRMRPVYWMWAGRIPTGALTVIPGREGIGKSLMLAWLAAQVTRGRLPGHWHGEPRTVIYAATEDSWAHTIAPRLMAAGADLDRVFCVEVEHAGSGILDSLTLPTDCDALAVEIARHGVALLAADPLLSLIDAGINTHHDRALRTALEPLVQLADRTGCAVVGLAHFNKSASPDALNLITGSRAFSAVARAVLAIARDTVADDGSCVLSQAKNNLGQLDLPSLRYIVQPAEIPTPEGPAHVGRLVFTGESDRSVADILGEATGDGDSHTERDMVAGWLSDYLTGHGGQAPAADVIKAARADGIAERTLQRARARAGVRAVRTGFPARTVWELTTTDHGPSPDAVLSGQSCQSRHVPERGGTGRTAAGLAGLAGTDHTPSPAARPGCAPEGTAP